MLLVLSVVASPLRAGATCAAPAGGESVQVRRVVDGDTLVLVDGRRVRLIGVNAPEKRRESRPGEPLAETARNFVRGFVKDQQPLVLQVGEDARDRYGRTLAHLYNRRGVSLEERLLAQGLARHLVVGRNDRLWECLARAEERARQARVGLWALPHYQVRNLSAGVQKLSEGFHLVRDRVAAVSLPKGRSWWLDLEGDLAVLIRPEDHGAFDSAALRRLVGSHVEVRGWLIDRGARGKTRWLLPVSHPAMIRRQP